MTAGRGRGLYGHYHRLVDDLVQSVEPGADWQPELKAQIAQFEADVHALDSESARLLREELCAQFEHEALHTTRPLSREILLAAVKWLEIED